MKKLCALILALCLSLGTINFSNAQIVSLWAKPSVERLEKKKIIPEILKNKNLKDRITRLEFTHLIITYLMSNKSYTTYSYPKKYKDIDDNFVNLSSHLGITTGYTDGNFKPNMYITRSEAAVIAHNVEKILGSDKDGSAANFKDYKFIPKWAVKSVGSMVQSNVLSGYPGNNFGPSRNITRQEAIVMVDKLVLEKSNRLIDAFDIAKNDEYLTKLQYDFILANIPTSKYKLDLVRQRIFQTEKEKRIKIYERFIKTVPFSSNEIKTSPDLIFDDDQSSYILGIEKRILPNEKKEQRAFMLNVSLKNGKFEIDSQKEFSSWFTVEK